MSKSYKSAKSASAAARKIHGPEWESAYEVVETAGEFALVAKAPVAESAPAETQESAPETVQAAELPDLQQAAQELHDSATDSTQVLADEIAEIPPTDAEIAESNAEPVISVAPSAFGALVGAVLGNGTPPAPPATPEQPAQKTGSKIEQNRPEQNGLKRPSTGSTCEIIWRKCDAITAEKGTSCTSGELFAALPGLNECTLRTQYARWRQFNGITGRLPGQSKTAPKASPEFQDVKDCLLARIPEDNATARETLESVADPVALVAWMWNNTANF